MIGLLSKELQKMQNNDIKPLIVLDMKKKRIRIHKVTLKSLDNPEYIQLLINPEEQILVLLSGSKSDHLAHKVNYEKLKNNCCELYSLDLIRAINTVVPQLNQKTSYRFTGDLVAKHNLVRFALTDPEEITSLANEKEHIVYVH